MTKTILMSVTAFMLLAGAWTANLVCYPSAAGTSVDPLAPISITADWH
jgi:hypothetical protein